MGDELKYMGTTTVARDVAFMAETLDGDDALINLYGGSYGTVLGQYIVNMFPDRVGRIVLDGVVDTVRWTSTPPYKWVRQWLSSTDDTYTHFVSECFNAGPQGCPLVGESDKIPSNVKDRIEAFINGLYRRPLAVPLANRPGLLTAGRARNYLIITLLKPFGWHDASHAINEAIHGNGTRILNFLNDWKLYNDLERPAVSCSDAPPFIPPSAEDVVNEYLDVYHNVSNFVFSVLTTEPDSGCQFWPVKPIERFVGPWNHTLRNPILLVSNTADPVTPITSGHSVVDLLGNSSRLLVVDSPGHCSLSLESLCMVHHVQAYFANGTLPEENAVCNDALKPFPAIGKPLSSQELSDEDRALLSQLRGLGEQWEIARAGLDHRKYDDYFWWD
ncbi:hypothetical protein QCA50_014042 [Cerrena zonata]|uniref:Peptidase S33 tripeptidyl aminopeptidase-like C-terminal domain-containing protein n=1 Tax=Cerrena zonata TaxID=2478898 RepID=A0AAW0FWU0_9APHY